MIEFTGSLDVDQPPDFVFGLLADMSVLDRWNPNVTKAAIVEGRRLEPNSRYESTIKRGPMKLLARSELIDVERNKRVEYVSSIGMFRSVDSLTFEPTGSGTRITFRNVTQAPRWLVPLTPILNIAFQRQARKAVVGAADYLDRQ